MSYGDPRINDMMEKFTNHIGLAPTPKTLQRRYCSLVIKATGDKAEDLTTYAIGIQSDYYAPRVSSPKELYYKMANVMAYYKQHEADSGKVLNI